ncbi:MAG: RsmE family RNA methyltransferase [Bacteroidales bacterium]|nr:RsmE family RNA methyltransferase [Bacteroidales bacterium]MDY5262699.1 RsmE family RNA methyltransferase [Candidatus Cryptobacteroides sp.]
MEIFWTDRIEAGLCLLGEEESAHCVRVLRHREGDNVCVIDGVGTMYECVLSQASPKAAVARIEKANPGWGSHPYRMEMAVCPTKNIDRYEWFVEKASEVGTDRFVPVIGEHSERKVLKTERLRRIVLSAAKQSLKAAVPEIAEPLTVKDFITSVADSSALKMIACCFEDESHPRTSVMQALSDTDRREYIVLIGPEGDFSREEVRLAIEAGFIPVHLGESRLRTETAALAAVFAAYYNNI